MRSLGRALPAGGLFSLVWISVLAGPSPLALAPSGRAVFVTGSGEVAIADSLTASPRRLDLQGIAGTVGALAVSSDGARLFVSVSDEAQRRSLVVEVDAATGQRQSSFKAAFRITGMLLPREGGRLFLWGAEFAHGKKPPGGFVAKVDLPAGKSPDLIALPSPPADGALSPDEARLYLALPGVIQSVALKNWTLSWSFASFASARAIAVCEGVVKKERICVGGDEGIACYDPSDTAERGVLIPRVVIPQAGQVIELALRSGGDIGVALETGGVRLARLEWIQWEGAEAIRVDDIQLPVAAAGVAMWSAEKAAVLLMGGADVREMDAKPGQTALRITLQPPPNRADEPGGGVPAVPSKPATAPPPPAPAAPAPALPPAPATPAPASVPAPSLPPRPAEPPAVTPAPQEPPAPAPPSPAPVLPVPKPAPASAPAPGTISGTVGSLAGQSVEVVALGPNTLLNEAARARVRQDGSYTLEGLSPGRYRILVRGLEGITVAVDPAFQTVVLGEAGVSGTDFRGTGG